MAFNAPIPLLSLLDRYLTFEPSTNKNGVDSSTRSLKEERSESTSIHHLQPHNPPTNDPDDGTRQPKLRYRGPKLSKDSSCHSTADLESQSKRPIVISYRSSFKRSTDRDKGGAIFKGSGNSSRDCNHSSLSCMAFEKASSVPASDPGSIMISFFGLKTRRPVIGLLHLKDLENDAALFEGLREVYKYMRGWSRHFTTIGDISFVKYRLKDNGWAIVDSPSLPPLNRLEYKFSPRPAARLPPLPPDYFAYFINTHHDCGRTDDMVYQMLPKLVSAHKGAGLGVCPGHSRAEWGINVSERISFAAVIAFWLACVVLSSGLILVFGPVSNLQTVLACLSVTVSISGIAVYMVLLLAYRAPRSRPMPPYEPIPIFVVTETELPLRLPESYLRVIVPAIRRIYRGWQQLIDSCVPWLRDSPPPTRQRVGGDSPGSGGGNTSQPTPGQSDDCSGCRTGGGPCQNGQGHQGGHRQDGGEANPPDLTSLDHSNATGGRLYLHLIVPDQHRGKSHLPIDVTDIKTDYDLFVELRRAYRRQRGFWRVLFTIRSLRPTQYQLVGSYNARTLYNSSDLASTMPSLIHRTSKYVFSYSPPQPVPEPPLLDEHLLTPFLHNPRATILSSLEYDHEVYDRSPKRTSKLEYRVPGQYQKGYGFEFVEGFNFKFVLTCESFIGFLALLLAFLYFGFAKDEAKVGTSLNVAMLVFLVGQFLYGTLLAIGEKLEAWRF